MCNLLLLLHITITPCLVPIQILPESINNMVHYIYNYNILSFSHSAMSWCSFLLGRYFWLPVPTTHKFVIFVTGMGVHMLSCTWKVSLSSAFINPCHTATVLAVLSDIYGLLSTKIIISVFKDKNTPEPFVEDFTKYGDDGEAKNANKPDHIYMDCMGYGMGCSCLQMTFQACNIEEARLLYDQLNPLCPILVSTAEPQCTECCV